MLIAFVYPNYTYTYRINICVQTVANIEYSTSLFLSLDSVHIQNFESPPILKPFPVPTSATSVAPMALQTLLKLSTGYDQLKRNLEKAASSNKTTETQPEKLINLVAFISLDIAVF